MLFWQSSNRYLSISIAAATAHLRNTTTFFTGTKNNNGNWSLFFQASLHCSLVSSSSSPPPLLDYHLRRRRRKWAFSLPFETKWEQNFTHQQAMMALRKSVAKNTSKTHLLLSALIQSFATYQCDPSPDAYSFVLKTLTRNPTPQPSSSRLDGIACVLDHLQKVATFETPEYLFVDLIEFYGEHNMTQQAVDLFFNIPNFRCNPTLLSLNALLSVLCEKKWAVKFVPEILIRSQTMNIRLGESSFETLIRALCRHGKVNYAVQLLHCMASDGYNISGKKISLIIATMCQGKEKQCNWLEIGRFLEDLDKLGFCPRRSDWCNVIRCVAKRGSVMDSLEALNQMKAQGFVPDIVCYNWILDRLVLEEEYLKADDLFDEMLVLGLVPDIFTYNVYIYGLCKQNNLEEGMKMLASMEKLGCRPDLATYNTILGACCGSGELNLARKLLKNMKSMGVKLNFQTYEVMIVACHDSDEIDEACDLLREMADECSLCHSVAFDQILVGLCQRGLIDKAVQLLTEMAAKNMAAGFRAWEAILQGCTVAYSFQVKSAGVDDPL